ncbi:hypothetical protein MMC12_002561 [Toensbergia leucococca]|nr:hypothetical protein [Toensbergia leucococca]
MAPSTRLQDISDGVYLTDFHSDTSAESSTHAPHTLGRPFVILVHDPENSTMTPIPFSASEPETSSRKSSHAGNLAQGPFHLWPGRHNSWNLENSTKTKVEDRNGTTHEPSNNTQRSRLSMTLSDINVNLSEQRLSVGQAKGLARLDLHDPNTRQVDGTKTFDASWAEPPDGGPLAWAHAVAVHVIGFNAL